MAKPDVFAALDLEAALARSRAHQAVMIVDAMASWCGPCVQMDRTTWVAPAVVERLTGEATSFAIQIDVDVEQVDAARLAVTAMPTLIAFIAGIERDRIVGGIGPDDLIAWLDLLERRVRATALLAAGRHAEALPEFAALWTAGGGLELVDDITQLAAAHPPARATFAALRDAATPTGEPPPLDDVFAWMALNQIIGDGEATLAWYDAHGPDLPPSRTVARLVEVAVLPLPLAHGRWAAAGRALADPVATYHAARDARPDAIALRDQVGNLVRALYAAGREERADDLEFEARSADPSPEMTAALAAARTLGREDRR